MTNVATVEGGGDNDPFDNRDADPTAVLGQPDMAIDKSHTGSFTAGADANWRVFVQNIGNANAVQPVVRDTLPPASHVRAARTPRGTSWPWPVMTATIQRHARAERLEPVHAQRASRRERADDGHERAPRSAMPGDSDPTNDRDTDAARREPAARPHARQVVTGSFVDRLNAARGRSRSRTSDQRDHVGGVRGARHAARRRHVRERRRRRAGRSRTATGIVTAGHTGVLAANANTSFTLTIARQTGVPTAGHERRGRHRRRRRHANNNRDTDGAGAQRLNLTIDKRHTAPFGAGRRHVPRDGADQHRHAADSGAITVRDTLPRRPHVHERRGQTSP